MNKRNLKEVQSILTGMRSSMRRWPAAGVVAGVVNIDLDRNNVDHLIGTVDFGGVHYVALADAALERAIERMSAMSDPPLGLIRQCSAARACLDFEEVPPNG